MTSIDPSVIYKGGDRVFVYVNQRPINYVKSGLKELVSTIRNRYRQCLGLSDTFNKKNPFIYLDIQLEPNEYDGKLECVTVYLKLCSLFFYSQC